MVTQRLTRAIGRPVVRVTPFTGRGYTPARRMIVELSDGTTAFAKQAVNEHTAAALQAEHQHYQHLRGSFVPALFGWDDDGVEPILVLEDLSGAEWPPQCRASSPARPGCRRSRTRRGFARCSGRSWKWRCRG